MTDNSEQIRWLRDLAKNARRQPGGYTVALNAAADEIERLNLLVRDLTDLVHKFQDKFPDTLSKKPEDIDRLIFEER